MEGMTVPGIRRGYGLARISLERTDVQTRNASLRTEIAAFRLSGSSEKDSVFWLFYLLLELEKSGSLYLDLAEYSEFISGKGLVWNPDSLGDRNIKKYIVFENERFFFQSLHRLEEECAEMILRQKNFGTVPVSEYQPEQTLSEEQNRAVKTALESRLTLLTGGPGTGKTSILKVVLKKLFQSGISPKQTALTAPSGKAAKRMQESMEDLFREYPDLSAPVTIHRLLGYNPASSAFRFNSENPINASVLIADEASMIDVRIMNALLKAFCFNGIENSRLILSGDPNQLLSVDSGQVFSDLVQSGINTVRLTKTFRQSEEAASIRIFSENILKGTAKLQDLQRMEEGEDFTGIRMADSDETDPEKMLRWYADRQSESLQILSPYNEGTGGVDEINRFMQEKMDSENSCPAMVTRNLSDLNLFNGETGLLSLNGGELFFIQSGKKTKIPYYLKPCIVPAYAVTIHKSQGSEYDHVCLVLPERSRQGKMNSVLNIRLLFTAATRAKKSLLIIGKEEVFKEAMQNIPKRKSALLDKLNS
ncbi:MAG TPA: AAA family ATPase [Leptospiraceae bacterium]|nr:AAA family ATPase [Leptospiraceae bacterium]